MASNLIDRRKTQTRKEIAQVALGLFQRDGYGQVSVERIATQSGVSLSTFYRYFAGKEDVLAPLLESGTEALVAAVTQRPPEEDLATAARRAYAEIIPGGDDYQRVRSLITLMLTVPPCATGADTATHHRRPARCRRAPARQADIVRVRGTAHGRRDHQRHPDLTRALGRGRLRHALGQRLRSRTRSPSRRRPPLTAPRDAGDEDTSCGDDPLCGHERSIPIGAKVTPHAALRPPRKPARGSLRAVDPAPLRALPALAPVSGPGPGALRYQLLDRALEHQVAPDSLLRAGSRYGAWARERREARGGVVAQEERLRVLLRRMSSGPVAEVPEKANEQHYELPAEFLGLILGPRRKYSGALWERGTQNLAQAEEGMLRLSCLRAQVRDGMRILDLGCGWGSLSLWLAEQYPAARITGVSNSSRQRRWIESEREERGLTNLEVITADVNDFAPMGRYDRVMSIEMFEHMRNWHELLRRISTWLVDGGNAFVHVFSHRSLPYLFQGTWAADRFFTAGLMPSHDLLPRFQEHLELADRWVESGTHYAKTLEAWLARLDAHSDEALEVLMADGRSRSEARTLLGGWRLFLLSTQEIWRYRGGNHWLISHYLLEPRRG